jgi:hypothetical protein
MLQSPRQCNAPAVNVKSVAQIETWTARMDNFINYTLISDGSVGTDRVNMREQLPSPSARQPCTMLNMLNTRMYRCR